MHPSSFARPSKLMTVGRRRLIEPRDIARALVWYDFAYQPTSSGLTGVKDQSGGGNDATVSATAPTVGTAVQNGRSGCLSAAASSENLRFTAALPAAFSMYFVGTASAVASSYMLSATGNNLAIISHFTANSVEWFGDATERATFVTTSDTNWHIFSVDHTDAGTYQIWYDTVSQASGSSHATASGANMTRIFSTAGDASFSTNYCGELWISKSGILTSSQRTRMDYYFRKKWGI